MLIIFEGIDNVGKSTQIQLLRNYFAKKYNKVFITHHSSNYKDVSSEKHQELTKKEYEEIFKFCRFTDFICDRLHGGEYVYGQMYRNYENPDFVFDFEKEEKINLLDDVFLIVLVDEPKNVIERDDGSSFTTDLKKKDKEVQLFKEFFVKSNIKNKLLINIANKDIDNVFNDIITFIENTLNKEEQ